MTNPHIMSPSSVPQTKREASAEAAEQQGNGIEESPQQPASVPRQGGEGLKPASSRTANYCLAILTILAIFYTLYFARAILLPIAIALLLNLVLTPIVGLLRRAHIPSVVSAATIFILLSAAIGAGIYTLSTPATEWLERSPQAIRELGANFGNGKTSPLKKVNDIKDEVERIASVPGEEKPTTVRLEQPALSAQVFSTTGTLATSLTITLLLLFFLLASGDQFLEKMVQAVPTWRAKREVVGLAHEIQNRISKYLATIAAINIGLGTVIGIGLWMIGIPSPLLWGVLAALLNFIPFAGLVLGAVTVFVVAATEFSTLTHAVWAPAIYLVANGIEANLVTPLILGKSISLNPVVILLAIFIGGWIWGIGGIFLAVPILLVAKIISDSYEPMKPLAIFLSQ